jgi:phosphatidylserine/phosphatidylglycerophosphate/cardiolipin synthase-like enzyme
VRNRIGYFVYYCIFRVSVFYCLIVTYTLTIKIATTDNRYNSFAPIRPKTRARFYVDGQECYAAYAKAIYEAKQEIFIAGWMFSPLLYLIRGDHPSTVDFRLDVLLKHKASEGVKSKCHNSLTANFINNILFSIYCHLERK